MKRLLLIVLLFIVGCAAWVQVGGLYTSKPNNFSVEFPQGWMRYNKYGENARVPVSELGSIENLLIFPNADEYLCITRDGVLLQNILIERISIEEDLKHTKKKFHKEMLPQEAAEVIIGNMASNQAVLGLEVLENTPAKIGGFPGFKLVFTFKNESGLRCKGICYGFISGEWFYVIRYTAASRHYFDKDIKTFEEVFKSFKLIKTA